MIDEFVKDKLRIKISEDSKNITTTWLGESDDINSGIFLEPFFEDLIKNLASRELIILDFCQMDFINSSTFSSLILFLKEASTLPNVNLKVRYSNAKSWQDISFRCLKVLTIKHKNLHIEAR